MSFYNPYSNQTEPDISLTPFGQAKGWVLLFEQYPIFRAIGPLNDQTKWPEWTIYMARSDFALAELTPVTLSYANNRGGIFHDDESRGWYCFMDCSIESAYLAWDFAPFLEQVNWSHGIALIRESLDPDWIATRRSCASEIITRNNSQFLLDFYAQYLPESQDQAL